MIWLEEKYIALAGSQLRNFKKVRDKLYNFSCPICKDSEKNKYKARGYFYVHKQNDHFSLKCFNCGAGMRFSSYLKQFNQELHNKFRAERFNNTGYRHEKTVIVAKPIAPVVDGNWRSVLRHAVDVPDALRCLVQRQIPKSKYDDIYFIDDLNLLKGEFLNYNDVTFREEPRLALPIISQSQTLLGMVTRAIYPSKLRYINLRKETDEPLIYNLDKVNLSEPIFVFEGAFDSMFIDNSLAVDGAAFGKATAFLQKDRDTIIFDNERKNRALHRHMEKLIEEGFRLCIWPDTIKQKDVNAMILAGCSSDTIKEIIVQNTFAGLNLRLAFAQWKRT